MKSTSFLLFLAFTFSAFAGSKVILNPSYEVKNSGITNVSKIELSDTETRISIHIVFLPKWWYQFDGDEVLKDPETTKSYTVTGIEGAEFKKKLWMPKSGDSTIVLIFPPLDKSVKRIDYGTSIFGISLDEKQSVQKKSTEVQKEVTKWLNAELAKSTRKTPMDFKSDQFFGEGNARLVGYLKGYDVRLGFTTGIIYANNVLTREDFPVVVQIHPDGRFEADVPMITPEYTYMRIKDSSIPFYMEPGQALSLILDWEEFLVADRLRNIRYQFKNIVYQGPLAKVNSDLAGFTPEQFDYKKFQKKLETLTPEDFKTDMNKQKKEDSEKLEKYIGENKLTAQSTVILRNKIVTESATRMFDYVMTRRYKATQDTANKVLKIPAPISYYDFLKSIDLNDKSLLVTSEFSSFVNRFEYCEPLMKAQRRSFPTEQRVNVETNNWKIKDSILINDLGLKPNLVYEITKIRSLKFTFGQQSAEDANQYWNQLKQGIAYPYLIKTGDQLVKQTFPTEKVQAYTLPDGRATEIFRKIVDPFKGKILFVDFWATTCGPCVAGIQKMKPTRAKHYGNKDFDFIFITDERSSPEAAYKKFVAEQALENIYRLSLDDYNYLRQLFKFNGIPRYVVIDKDGKVLNDNFPMHNFDSELSRILSQK